MKAGSWDEKQTRIYQAGTQAHIGQVRRCAGARCGYLSALTPAIQTSLASLAGDLSRTVPPRPTPVRAPEGGRDHPQRTHPVTVSYALGPSRPPLRELDVLTPHFRSFPSRPLPQDQQMIRFAITTARSTVDVQLQLSSRDNVNRILIPTYRNVRFPAVSSACRKTQSCPDAVQRLARV